ncbi:MAG: hypothetical protein ACMVO5_04175 [Polymorphobacter sp.]|uniref:hypothetical protein n=1 Tax=Polymorphobacter sp. TaxID=1909290 RepID=UPI003A8C0DE5
MINRSLIALAAAGLAAISSPAFAEDASVCMESPAAIRAAAATAEPAKAKKALRYAAVGEQLCDAGGRREAAKKFAAAAKALDTDLAALTTKTASAQ